MPGRTGIVIPAYNRERFLRATVESVRAQTRQPSEVVAVDDGSTDGTVELLSELGVRTIRQANAGAPAARNRGRAALTTDPAYLLFLDSDDVLEPEMLATLEAHLDAHDEAGLAYCGLRIIDEHGQLQDDPGGWPARHAPGRFWWPRPVPDSEPVTPLLSIIDLVAIVPSVSMMRTSVFDQAGGWDERLRKRAGAEDTALAVEIALRSEVHHVPRPLVRYRSHGEQATTARDHLYETQRELHQRLRQREEPALREASRARDGQLRLKLSVERARDAVKRRDLVTAARASGGTAKALARLCAPSSPGQVRCAKRPAG